MVLGVVWYHRGTIRYESYFLVRRIMFGAVERTGK